MRKLLIVFLSVLGFNSISAQDNHFVYIQSENHKPFYLRINSKLFRASGDGYLLVSGLSKSSYQLYIGMDNPPAPEWKFNCEIANEDLAYTLKSSSKGLELTPMGKTTAVAGIKEEPRPEKKPVLNNTPVLTGPASDDAFSMLLSGVVNDPTIRERTALIQKESLVVVKETPKETPAEPAAKVNPPVTEPVNTIAAQKTSTDSVKNATASLSSDLITGLSKKDSAAVKPVSTSIQENKATAAKAVTDTLAIAKQTQPAAKKDTPLVVGENVASNTTPPAESFAIKEVKAADKKTTETKNPAPETKTSTTETKPVVPVAGSETFVVKETTKPAENTKPVAEPPVPANKQETKAITATDTPFVIKEVKAAEKTKSESKTIIPETAVVNSTAPAKNANEPFVVKEVTTATKKDSNTAVEKNNPVANTKEDKPFVIKETVPVVNTVDNKPAGETKVTAPVTSSKPASQDNQPFVVQEVVKSPAPKAVSSTIKKTLQRKSADGIELIYVEEYADGSKDTIRILIPAK